MTQEMHPENDFSADLLTFAAVLTFIIMIVGITGNLLTVYALIKCSKVRNVAAAFIISLCLADLIFCAIVLPFNALRFLHGTWKHGEFLCKLIPFIQYGNVGVSLLCIAMITINRYIMIAHHNKYGQIYKRHWIATMVIACWIFSYGMQIPTLLGIWGTFGYDPRLGTCSIMTDAAGNSSKTALFIIAFIIPCIIIVACYAKIFRVVHQSDTRMKRHSNNHNSIPNNQRPLPLDSNQITNISKHNHLQLDVSSSVTSSDPTTKKSESISFATKEGSVGGVTVNMRERRAKLNEWRITKMVLVIFLSFVLCYLPITIVKVVDVLVQYPAWHIISYICLYLSACINPIIYVIMNKQYRKAYKAVIKCSPPKSGGGVCKFFPFMENAMQSCRTKTATSVSSIEVDSNVAKGQETKICAVQLREGTDRSTFEHQLFTTTTTLAPNVNKNDSEGQSLPLEVLPSSQTSTIRSRSPLNEGKRILSSVDGHAKNNFCVTFGNGDSFLEEEEEVSGVSFHTEPSTSTNSATPINSPVTQFPIPNPNNASSNVLPKINEFYERNISTSDRNCDSKLNPKDKL